MAYELIPGVRQDHRGRSYQLGRYPNGKSIMVPVEECKLSEKTLAALAPVEVETQSRLVPGDPKNPQWVERALEQGSLFKQGDTFQSLQCFQGSRL